MMKIIIGVLIHVQEFPDGKGCTNASVKGQSLADTLMDQAKNTPVSDTGETPVRPAPSSAPSSAPSPGMLSGQVQLDGQVPWFKCVGKGSTELNNRGGLVTNLKTDLYGWNDNTGLMWLIWI